MNISKNTSLGLIAAAVALVLIALVEHFALKVALVPHLAYILGGLAVVIGAVGVWGYLGGRGGAS